MGHHKHKAGNNRATETPRQHSTQQSGTGGREFGQVIEPMQAQMASGNEGLAESSSARQPARPAAKKSTSAKKGKAA